MIFLLRPDNVIIGGANSMGRLDCRALLKGNEHCTENNKNHEGSKRGRNGKRPSRDQDRVTTSMIELGNT